MRALCAVFAFSLGLLPVQAQNVSGNDPRDPQRWRQARTVTEFEGPFVIQDRILDELLTARVPADNYHGCDVLAAAARTRHRAAVTKLLAAGAPVQSRGQGSEPRGPCDALTEGVEGGDPVIVKQLLARKPDPNGVAQYRTPLMNLALAPGYVPGDTIFAPGGALLQRSKATESEEQENRIAILRMLLAAGADPRRPLPGTSNTAQDEYRIVRRLDLLPILEAWLAAHPAKSP